MRDAIYSEFFLFLRIFQEQTIPIPDHLRAFVRRVWMLAPEMPSGDVGPNKFSIYADGCPGLIFQESENGLLLNQQRELSPVFLYGQTVDPIDMYTNGRLGMIVVSFHPHVLHCLFGFSAKELTDDCLDLRLLSAVPGIRLQERLWNAGSIDERIAVLFNYIGQVIVRNRSIADAGMAYVTENMIRTNGGVSLQQMQRELHLSQRTFERRFEQYVGVPPKLFSKIAQFQAALKQLQSGNYDKLSDIAYEHGYADQSHFIRNFSKFTGLSPLRFFKRSERTVTGFPGLFQ